MRKRLILRTFIFGLYLVMISSVWAEIKGKYYYDYAYDYRGAAFASYMGKVGGELNPYNLNQETMDFYAQHNGYTITEIQKLTRELNNLLYCAVSEYDFEDDEVYIVFVNPGAYKLSEDEGYCFSISTCNQGNSFVWYGFYYSTRKRY